ncbi:hypothetical protein Cgig2_021015 [Carnegiea gigantea]|uniref:Endonuclease/exonuclease/phosphatase domain-containing protein n=1 Tax=Carnegiea gigantea TaxID=171969 RepID=A0A9Q1JXQ7_9CARY|nr:hypothetical protein Cgig2_021015 [Carnegiea gigantea]
MTRVDPPMDNIQSWNIKGLNYPNKQEEKPTSYNVIVLRKTKQLIHCKVAQLSSYSHFHITIVYVFNQDYRRMQLWDDLINIAQTIYDGDIYSILHVEYRIEGTEIQDIEIKHFAEIDWALANTYWHADFDFVHVNYMSQGLSDHNPLLLRCPSCARPKETLMLGGPLKKLNKDIFANSMHNRHLQRKNWLKFNNFFTMTLRIHNCSDKRRNFMWPKPQQKGEKSIKMKNLPSRSKSSRQIRSILVQQVLVKKVKLWPKKLWRFKFKLKKKKSLPRFKKRPRKK